MVEWYTIKKSGEAMFELEQYGIGTGDKKKHEELVYMTALIYNLLNNDITSYLTKYNLSPGKLNILVAMRHHGGNQGLAQIEISRHLIVTKSNMTKHLDKLENEGMITRSARPGDKRVKIIKITKKAEELLDAMWDEYNQRLESLTSRLSKEKKIQLSELLFEWFGTLIPGDK
ncbi:MAG: MarR family transcriptional regulator [Candidatus Omnitrophica bacterium]|nr:MarR family transcriptional regulator [Candidatus Omnitrophota bacterium]MCB9748027.1 MarR family transcriptional regulator [Candidatus Omnitrophota bacterium]